MTLRESKWVVCRDAAPPFKARKVGNFHVIVDITGGNALETPDRQSAWWPDTEKDAHQIAERLNANPPQETREHVARRIAATENGWDHYDDFGKSVFLKYADAAIAALRQVDDGQ